MDTILSYDINVNPFVSGSYTYAFGCSPLSTSDIEKIRAIVAEEVHEALHPEEPGQSATVEYVQDGKTWRGTVYLVEDEDE